MADEPREDAYDLGNTDLTFNKDEKPRDDKGRFVADPVPVAVDPAHQLNPPPAASKLPEYLVNRSREYGFTDADLQDLTAPLLDRMLVNLDRERQKLRAEFQTQRTLTDAPRPAPAPAEPAPPVDDDYDIPELSAEEFTDELRKPWSKVSKLAKKVKELEAKIAEGEKREVARVVSRGQSIVDAAFAGLGKEYERFVGTGAGREMKADQPEFRRRLLLLQEAGIQNMSQVDRATCADKLKKAAQTLFGEQKPEQYEPAPDADPKPKPSRIKPEDWNAAAVAHPTRRANGVEPKGEELAKRNLAAKLRQQDTVDAEDSDVADGLL